MGGNIHKQEFLARNLQTRSVTLYPTRAQIVRDIKKVILTPGANEVTILGLTPTADENSIKIDGKGSVTITDLMVELIPNPDNYEDIYPEPEDDAEESEDEQSESEPESDATNALAVEKSKRLEKKQKLLQEKAIAKHRLKEARVKFWPRKVYRVTLSLDTNSELTPASSRRSSIDSPAKPTPEFSSSDPCQVSLSISYITHSAYWSPRYDLSLDTITSSGLIIYRAEYCNTTSETWKDAQAILSTPQPAFQGLGEPIPALIPWHVRLSKGLPGTRDDTNGALMSIFEMENRRKVPTNETSRYIEPRNALFGLNRMAFPLPVNQPPPPPQQPVFMGQQQAAQNAQRQQQMQQQYALQQQRFGQVAQQQQSNVPSNVANLNSGLFGPSSAGNPSSEGVRALQDYQMQILLLEQHKKQRLLMARQEQDRVSGAGGPAEGRDDGAADNIVPDLPTLDTEEPESTESGLTTSYDIGRRTVVPSFTTRRHKIASVHLKDVHLSYVLVPKLRAAAYLKARLRNTSSVALLKGPAGLTLDGSFLGNTYLPRCSAGAHLHLSLGIDPSVNVLYSNTVVKRSQTGLITTEGSGIYTRTCTITNTKPDRAIAGTVLDQVPVSEEERLRVEVLQPAGLRTEGDAVETGTGVVVGEGTEKWGRATAVLKKGGQVAWEVKIEPGRGAKLVLEYEARFPSSEMIVSA